MWGLNPFVVGVAALQVIAGGYGFWVGNWKQGVCNVALGVANAVFATMK